MTHNRVLFLGADPTGGTFALDGELAMVSAELRACGRGLAFEILSNLDVQPHELQRLLNQHEPDLLHFSGHVTESGELLFVDEAGKAKGVGAELLARIIASRQKRVRCVVLNACNGSVAAPALRDCAETIVAMVGMVTVRAAQVFSRRFYEAVAGEYDVRAAFEQGLLEVELLGYREELQAVLIEAKPGAAARVAFPHGQPRNPHPSRPHPPNTDPRSAPGIFVSYAHEDETWMKRLSTMMQPLQRTHGVEVWDDRRIQASADWHPEIDRALSRARIAVLLVSQHFLESDFIANCELPAILAARERRELEVLWVYIAPCLIEASLLAPIQAAHRPCKPLLLLSKAKQEQHLLQVAQKASELLRR